MMNKPHILITRPVDDSIEIADLLEEKGYEPVIEPMLEIVPVKADLPKEFQAIIFTSANAVRLAKAYDLDKSLPAYCVGNRTASIARDKGWQNVKSAGGNVNDLNLLLEQEDFISDLPLLHLAGEDIATPVSVQGTEVLRAAIYQARQAAKFSPLCFDLLMKHALVYVLFFSSRSAEAFSLLVRKYGAQEALQGIKALCLSDSVVKSLHDLQWQSIECAYKPERQALLDLVDNLQDR